MNNIFIIYLFFQLFRHYLFIRMGTYHEIYSSMYNSDTFIEKNYDNTGIIFEEYRMCNQLSISQTVLLSMIN